MSLHVKLLDIDYPLTFEESKLRQIEAHALIYLRDSCICRLIMVYVDKRIQNSYDCYDSLKSLIFLNLFL